MRPASLLPSYGRRQAQAISKAMADTPIPFYELASVADTGGPYFSPHCFRARLAFALKGVPITTVEVSLGPVATPCVARG